MILVLADLWPPFPGGAERLMFNLARDLHRRGETVEVLTGYERAQQFDGAPLTVRPIGVLATRDEGWEIVRAEVERRHPDVVLTSHLYASQFADAIVEMGVPLVHVLLNGRRIEGAALTVYISQWVHERWGGTDADLILTPPVFDDVVADTHGDAIGFVKPIPHKGVETIYELAARMPEYQFVILRGEWQDIEVVRELPNIEFMEPVDDMRDFYRRCRLILMPSRSEDAGTVAQEATANGLPCISSDVDGLAETNGGGIRLHPHDTDAWEGAVRLLLSDADAYSRHVAAQRDHLASTSQAARLDEFAARVAEVAHR